MQETDEMTGRSSALVRVRLLQCLIRRIIYDNLSMHLFSCVYLFVVLLYLKGANPLLSTRQRGGGFQQYSLACFYPCTVDTTTLEHGVDKNTVSNPMHDFLAAPCAKMIIPQTGRSRIISPLPVPYRLPITMCRLER